jgi:hypothetical protein
LRPTRSPAGTHGRIDAIARHGAAAASAAAEHALVALGVQEAAGHQEIDRWEAQAVEGITTAAQRLRAPLPAQAASAAAELRTGPGRTWASGAGWGWSCSASSTSSGCRT